jgi:uncharacterized protein YcfJ
MVGKINAIETLLAEASELTSGLISNPIATAVGGAVGGAVIGGLVTAAVIKSTGKKSSKSRASGKRGNRIKHTKRGWLQDRKRRSKQKWEVAYQRRKKHKKSKKSKGIHYTKNGQPYKILASGKARFIKK